MRAGAAELRAAGRRELCEWAAGGAPSAAREAAEKRERKQHVTCWARGGQGAEGWDDPRPHGPLDGVSPLIWSFGAIDFEDVFFFLCTVC